jgi:predicted short-subunit dehydrogenase-like oxidoreductase (DUF2520 family)
VGDLEAILDKLAALERRDGELASSIGDLRDALIVTAEIQRRQAEVQRGQAEWLAAHEERLRRIELNLAEATDKLNGLIGFMDDFFRRRPPE